MEGFTRGGVVVGKMDMDELDMDIGRFSVGGGVMLELINSATGAISEEDLRVGL